jgi:hypothetical protein
MAELRGAVLAVSFLGLGTETLLPPAHRAGIQLV